MLAIIRDLFEYEEDKPKDLGTVKRETFNEQETKIKNNQSKKD